MKIGDLSSGELAHRLRDPGICLQTGPFLTHLRTPIPLLARAMQFLYPDFNIEAPGQLVDFHICVDRPKNLRRWMRPQAQFYLEGNTPSNPMPLRLAVPLLEWGMNWAVARNAYRFVVVHAAVAEKAGRALMLIAPPGTGKSTLCAALVYRGWRLFSDELLLIRLDDGRIVPLPRPIGLKNESIAVIREFAPHAGMSPEWKDTHKGTVAHLRPPRDAVQRAGDTAMPGWILFLTYRPGDRTRLEPVPKARAFLRVADSAFNYSELGLRGFETVADLIDACDCYEFSYSRLDEAVERLSGLGIPG